MVLDLNAYRRSRQSAGTKPESTPQLPSSSASFRLTHLVESALDSIPGGQKIRELLKLKEQTPQSGSQESEKNRQKQFENALGLNGEQYDPSQFSIEPTVRVEDLRALRNAAAGAPVRVSPPIPNLTFLSGGKK